MLLRFLIGILLLNACNLYGQNTTNKRLQVQNFSSDNGLPNNNIWFVFQDYRGFYWIGTFHGLSRFDGYTFKNLYSNFNTSNGTSISQYKSYAKLNDSIYWICAHLEGILELNVNTCTTKPVPHFNFNPTTIYLNPKGDIYVGTLNQGLFLYQKNNKQFKRYLIKPMTNEFRVDWYNNNISKIIEDKFRPNLLWVGSKSGLYEFNKTTENFIKHEAKISNSNKTLALNQIIDLCADKDGNIWVGRFYGGIGKWNIKTETWENYFYNPKDFYHKFSNDNIAGNLIFTDQNTLLFGGTKGPIELDISNNTFHQYEVYLDKEKWEDGVSHLYFDSYKNLWIGYWNQKGICVSSKKINTTTFFPYSKEKDIYANPNPATFAWLFSKKLNVYYRGITRKNGLEMLDTNFNTIKKIPLAALSNGLENFATGLAEDGQKHIWILDRTGMIWVYNPHKNTIAQCKSQLLDCQDIFHSQSSKIYAKTNKALFEWEQEQWKLIYTGKQEILRSNIHGETGYISDGLVLKRWNLQNNQIIEIGKIPDFAIKNTNYLQSIFFDSKNRLWVAMEFGGLYCYHLQNHNWTLFRENNGLSNGAARKLVEDHKHNLFVMCSGGLFYYKEQGSVFENMYKSFNRQKYNWYEGFIEISKNNELILCDNYGNYLINLESLIKNNNPPPVISSVSGNEFEYNYISNSTIIIPNYENSFRIYFSNLDVVNNTEVVYQYLLHGVDADWKKLDNGKNSIEFTHLKAGKYTLSVRVLGENKITNMQLVIKQRWYLSSWFHILLGLLVLLLIFYWIFSNQQKKYKSNLLQKQVAEYRLMLLQSRLNPHFLFNCLTSISGLIKTGDTIKAENILMDFSKLMRTVLEVLEHPLIPLEDELALSTKYLNIEKMRKNNNFSYEIILENENFKNLMVPPMLLQPFIENCIKHGFANLEQPSGLITVSVQSSNSSTIISVKDNGMGFVKNKSSEHLSKALEIQQNRFDYYRSHLNLNIRLEIKSGLQDGYEVLIFLD